MDVYRYFGLNRAPFEGPPDPDYFYSAPAHREILATLEFAAHAGKACTLVLGDSGSGKTLLGLLLARRVNVDRVVVWVHGIGWPGRQTAISICGPGTVTSEPHSAAQRITPSTLADWLPGATALPQSAVLIVDDADGLRARAWEDLLSLLTREVRGRSALSLVLLALPSLVETLAQAPFVRLQRRLFRTCQLTRLGLADTLAYVRHRLQVSGADNREIFTPAAVNVIQRFADGNPALINQLCDNSLVDAFGDDRTCVDAAHVIATVTAISGGIRRQMQCPHPSRSGPCLDAPAASDADTTLHLPRPRETRVHAAPVPCNWSRRHAAGAAITRALSDRLHMLECRLSATRVQAREARVPTLPPAVSV